MQILHTQDIIVVYVSNARRSRLAMGRERIASLHFLSTLKAAQYRLQLRDKTLNVTNLCFICDTCVAHEPFGTFFLHHSIHSGRYLRSFATVATDVVHGSQPVSHDPMHNGSLPFVAQIGAKTERDLHDDAASPQAGSDVLCLPIMLKATQSSYSGDIFFESEGSDDDAALPVEKDDSPKMDITLFGQLGKSETVMSIYQILKAEEWSSPGTEEKLSSVATTLSPDSVIEVVKLLKDAQMALRFLTWAKDQRGYEPRAEVYTHVIARFGRERDFNSAWHLLVEMKGCKLPIDFTFSIFLHRLKRARKAQGLVKAMCGMTFLGVNPTVALYTSALEFLLKVGAGDDATHLYKQMLQDGLVPDKKLYEVLVVGFIKIGKLDDALLLLDDMKHRGYVPHVLVYTVLVGSMSVAKRLDEGHELYEEMLGTGCVPKVFGVNEIACALHGEDTMKMVERFLKLVEIRPYKWKIQSHNNLLRCLFNSGRWDEARAVFERVPREEEGARANPRKDFVKCYWNLDSYHIYIIGMCKLGQLALAMDTFKELVDRCLQPINEISSFILLSLSNAKMIDEALAFSKHITRARESVSVDAQSAFYTALRTSGHLSVALKIFASMKRRGCIDEDADFVSLIGLETKDDKLPSMV